jgi:hypothetical protein
MTSAPVRRPPRPDAITAQDDGPGIPPENTEAPMLTQELRAEIEAGQGESLTRAARRFPPARLGRPVTLSCLVRWITRGVKGPEGQRVKLEAARLAGRWITTAAACGRFVEAQTPRMDDAPPPGPRTSGVCRRAADWAAKELERLGI